MNQSSDFEKLKSELQRLSPEMREKLLKESLEQDSQAENKQDVTTVVNERIAQKQMGTESEQLQRSSNESLHSRLSQDIERPGIRHYLGCVFLVVILSGVFIGLTVLVKFIWNHFF